MGKVVPPGVLQVGYQWPFCQDGFSVLLAEPADV